MRNQIFKILFTVPQGAQINISCKFSSIFLNKNLNVDQDLQIDFS